MPKTPLLRSVKKLFQDAHVARQNRVTLADLSDMRAETRASQPLIERPVDREALTDGPSMASPPHRPRSLPLAIWQKTRVRRKR